MRSRPGSDRGWPARSRGRDHESGQPCDSCLAPRDALVAAVREELLAADRAQADVVDDRYTRRLQLRARDRLQIDPAAVQDPRARGGERLADLVTDLVAARSGTGSDSGRELTARAELAHRTDPLDHHARRQTA